MRLILMFDLPIKTKKDVRIYTRFRKDLILQGYLMMQYSVYIKMFPNRDAAVNHMNKIRKEVPAKGNIRILLMTEKQYSKMDIVVGGKSYQENILTKDSFIKL